MATQGTVVTVRRAIRPPGMRPGPLSDLGPTALATPGRSDVYTPDAPRVQGVHAALRNVAELTATALRAPAAFVVVFGEPPRVAAGGTGLPPWASGAAVRFAEAGFAERVAASRGTVAVTDARRDTDPELAARFIELGLAGVVGTPLFAADGVPLGALCAVDYAAAAWTADDVELLAGLALHAAAAIELHQALAEQRRTERALRRDLARDPLTGLLTRPAFLERLRDAGAVPRAGSGPRLCAVLVVDVDHFTAVNESVGHEAGDEVLALLARRLEAVAAEVPAAATACARTGDDELALLLEHADDANALSRAAARVQAALSAPAPAGGFDVHVTVSVGVAVGDVARERPEQLLRSASMALRRAKRNGRARVELFTWTMHAEALTKLQTGTDLRGALQRSELELHYLPVVCLETGEVCAAEALVRWRHPRRGLLAGGEFIGVAEETGLIVQLGRWALGEACRQVKAWNDARPGHEPLGVAVNLSTRQFSQPDLARQVSRALKRTGLAPALLSLEITEGAVVGQPDLAPHTLAALRKLGVRVSMDDFGTGYSSLNYLHRLPLDAVKIDRAFVSEMEADGRALHLVRTVLATVQQLGLETVAEGVSSPRQLEALRELGCTHAQGHYFAAPLDARAFESLVREGPRW